MFRDFMNANILRDDVMRKRLVNAMLVDHNEGGYCYCEFCVNDWKRDHHGEVVPMIVYGRGSDDS